MPPGPTGLQPLPDMLARLSRAPVVSIVSIRGRATGVGSELALASDMRFAGREKAILSQWKVGAGLVPGGGPMARLPRLIGRGRALEVYFTRRFLPQSTMGKAIQDHWESLEVYLQDPLIEIDNNLVENAIRPTALGKNYEQSRIRQGSDG
jgi:Transposase IS66 family/Enoyl-CoA hydratase/isomerase